MKETFYKIIFSLYRLLGINRNFKINAGPLKGYRWNVGISDNRYLLGNYEEEQTKIITDELQSGKGMVDIGANAGYFSLLADKILKGKRPVYSFEPMPRNILYLKEHVEVNGASSVIIDSRAVAGEEGKLKFSNSENLSANTYMKSSSVYDDNTITVEAVSLDTLAQQDGWDNSWLIKIDVEGAELDVLNGGEKYLLNYKPHLILATHDCHVDGVEKECLKKLKTLGYTNVERIEDEKTVPGQVDYYCKP